MVKIFNIEIPQDVFLAFSPLSGELETIGVSGRIFTLLVHIVIGILSLLEIMR